MIAERESAMDPWVVHRLREGSETTQTGYLDALERRGVEQCRFAQSMAGLDLLVTPATPFAAIPVADVDELDRSPATYTRIFNYLDLPALALPAGFSESGLPVGIQLVAPADGIPTLLRAAAALERSIGLGSKRPPLAVVG